MDNISKLARAGQKVAWITIIINIALAVGKLVIGWAYSSQGLVADGFHSASDVLSTFIVLITIHISTKPADEGHPYGHGKVEDIGTKFLGIILLLTAIYITWKSGREIIKQDLDVVAGPLSMAAALVSIIVKEGMFRYTLRAGEKLKNRALIADAWHHRTDAFSSIAALIGLVGANQGLEILDPIAGVVVGLMIGYKAVEILQEAIENLMDTSRQDFVNEVSSFVRDICVVKELREVRSRKYGWQSFLDITIAVNKDLTVEEGHDVATFVQQGIIAKYDEVSGVLVHIEPLEGEGKEELREGCS